MALTFVVDFDHFLAEPLFFQTVAV